MTKVIEKIKNVNSNFYDDILESLKYTILSHVLLNDKDNPTEIFETINTTGKKLTPADMIKNYIFFYSYQYVSQEEILARKYDEIENLLCVSEDKKKYDSDMMSFYRYFNNIIDNQKLAKKESIAIFHQFKEIYKKNDFSKFDDVNNVLDTIKRHAWIWNKIHKYEPKKSIDKFFYFSFKDAIYTYYSLVHQLFDDKLEVDSLGNYFIDDNYVREVFRVVAKLVFSLLISGKAEKEITRDIPNIYKSFKESNYTDFEEWMISRSKEGEEISILDREGIEKYINNTNVYLLNNKRTKYLLFGIEGMLDNWEIEIKKFDDFSVEHISPQNPDKDSDYYKYALSISNNNDVDAQDYLERIKHKLANLTLVSSTTNSVLSNKPFSEKIRIFNEKTFLSINKMISNYTEWTQDVLKKRSEWFVDQIDRLFTR